MAPPSREVFDSGTCGADGIYFRDNAQVYTYRTAEGTTAKEGMFPLDIGLRCIFSADGRHALCDAPADKQEFVLRKGPKWEVAGVIPQGPNDGNLTTVWVAPDQQSLTWMGLTSLNRYDFKTRQRTELVARGPYNVMVPETHASAPDWFLISSSFSNPALYRIRSARDGAVLHESKPWLAFADELDLRVVGVSSNKRGLWLCGSGSRPILVDLETGQPVLRLHVFADSTYLWETPDERVAGSPDAKSRCLFISEDGMNAIDDLALLKCDPEGVKSILRSYSQ